MFVVRRCERLEGNFLLFLCNLDVSNCNWFMLDFFFPCSVLSYCIFIFLITNTLMHMNEYYAEKTMISCERKKVKTYTVHSYMCIEILLPWSRLASLGGGSIQAFSKCHINITGKLK